MIILTRLLPHPCQGSYISRVHSIRQKIPAYGVLLTSLLASPGQASSHLEEMGLDQLMQIKVTGASKYEQKQSQVAASVSILTQADIKAYGWRTLNEALASLPGLYNTYDRQYHFLGTRGLNPPGDFNSRILVAINGNRINDAVYDQGPTGRDLPIDINLIERIEFIPGPGSAVYGQNAMLGVVNIITRNGSGINGVELSTSYQTPESAFQERITWGKKFSNGTDAMISFSGLQSQGRNHFMDFGSSGISGTARHMDGEDVKQAAAKITRGPLSFDFNYGNRFKQDPTAGYLSDPLFQPPVSVRDTRLNTQIQYNDNFANDSLNVMGRLFLGQYQYKQPAHYNGIKTLSTGLGDWHGAELRLLSTALTNHKLMLGFEYQFNTHITQTFQDSGDPANNVAVHSSVLRTGVYAQDEWQIIDTLLLTAGLRYDYNQWNGHRLSPRGAAIWQPADKITLKALYGRAQRAPNSFERDYSDRVSQISNPMLHGENIDTFELVGDYRIQPDMNLRGTLYQWYLHHLIIQENLSSGLLQFQQSATKITSRGLELSADKSWDWGGRLRSSFTLQDAERTGSRLSNSPLYMAKLNFSIPIHLLGMRVSYEMQYNSKRKNTDGSSTDGYVISNLNLTGNVKWVKGLEASLALYNLAGENYYYPVSDIHWQNSILQDGRSIRFKLDYRY